MKNPEPEAKVVVPLNVDLLFLALARIKAEVEGCEVVSLKKSNS